MRGWPNTDLLAARAATTPSSTAIIDVGDGIDKIPTRDKSSPKVSNANTDETGSFRLSYGELDAVTNNIARRMTDLGIEPGDHVGAILDTSVQFVAVSHALERLGAVLVPLNVRLTVEELTTHCEQADVTHLLCSRETESRAVQAAQEAVYWAGNQVSAPRVYSMDDTSRQQVTSLWEESIGRTIELDSVTRSPTDRRLILFTSGTTGSPKAVPLTTGNLLANAIASAFRLGVVQEDRWLCALPMYHMGGIGPVIRSTLYGTTVVLQRSFDENETPAVARQYDVTGVSLVPTMLRRIFDADEELPGSLRFVLLGGGAAGDELIRQCERREVPVFPTYGMTEAASQIATARPAESFNYQGTVGMPLFGTDVTIVNRDGEPVSPGMSGEIVVSGPSITSSYYGDEDATEDSFGPHGLHTGDVGYRDQVGRLWITNRREDRIVTGGENVDPSEVARVIRDCPGVREVVVLGIEDAEWGERVSALIVPGENAEISRNDIIDQCRGRLARYKHPRTVGFTDALPRTPSGSINRSAVRELLRE